MNYFAAIDWGHVFATYSRQFFVFVVLIPVLAALINFFLINSVIGYRYRWFAAPGVILHELSHAFLCLFTGARIQKVSLFDKKGGSVEHSKSRIPFLGQILISIAPIIFGVLAIYFLARLIGLRQVDIHQMTFTTDHIVETGKNILAGINFHSYRQWILIYLILSITVTMTPSVADFKNIALSVIFAGAAIWAVYHYTQYRINLSLPIPEQFYLVISTVLILLIICLLLSMILYVVSKLFRT